MNNVKWISVVAAALCLTATAWAAEAKPAEPLPEPTAAELTQRAAQRVAGHCRAGCPQVVAPYARLSDDGHSLGYYVGGGAALGGDRHGSQEGTWGWDYGGFVLPKLVDLSWWHGRHGQGSANTYRTDGVELRNPR